MPAWNGIEDTMEAPIAGAPVAPRNIVNIKRVQAASRRLAVIPRDPERRRYLVESGSESGQFYEIALQRDELAGHCTCQWSQHGGINCKHVLAALCAEYEPWGALSFWPTPEAARRQHRRVLPGEHLYATLRPLRHR